MSEYFRRVIIDVHLHDRESTASATDHRQHQGQDLVQGQLLLTKGLGPRMLRALALVSEVIHGTPSHFCDPARFFFDHVGKDGHPFPVPMKIYDRSITVLRGEKPASRSQKQAQATASADG